MVIIDNVMDHIKGMLPFLQPPFEKDGVMSEDAKAVLVFSKEFGTHSYGPNHPLKVERLQLTMDLIGAYGLWDTTDMPWVEAHKAEEQDLYRIHSAEYLEILKKANEGRLPLVGV